MKTGVLEAIFAASLGFNLAIALPGLNGRRLEARQDIDFKLADSTPDPTIRPDDTSNFNPAAAIASVVAAISAHPLPQSKRSLEARDIVVTTYPGYTENVPLGNAAINAPLDCNKKDTYMGSKLFTSSAFDTALCAAACSAQSAYNLRHPPANGPAKTCQFYNTYELYKNSVYQGQYCALYNQTWNATYATNKGQYRGSDHYTIKSSYISSNATNPGTCPQPVTSLTKTQLDLTGTTFEWNSWTTVWTEVADNLVAFVCANFYYECHVFSRLEFPVVANQLYELSFEYFLQPNQHMGGHYYFGVGDGDPDSEAYVHWWQELIGTPTQQGGMDQCWKDKVMPQTVLENPVWRTGKLFFKPTTNLAHLRWDFTDLESSGMQWQNVYLTPLPANSCSSG